MACVRTAALLLVVGAVACAMLVPAVVGHWSHHATGGKRVRLSDVQTLTLSSDRMTTGRRSAPVPQMQCVGGSANCHRDVLPPVMQCRNMGSDGVDVQWQCTSDVDESVKLGRTDVTCEGFDYPDDPYILAGSCGVEYTLESTGNYASRHGRHSGHHYHHHHGGASGGGSNFLLLLVLAVLGYQLYKWCVRGRAAQDVYGDDMDPNEFRPGGRFGGNPPPPGGYPGGPGCNTAPPTYQQAVNQGAGAGGGWNFWHGFGLGGLLGYMAPRRQQYYGYGARPGWGFRRGYANTGFDRGFRRAPSPPRPSRTHTSTGFGGTRRR